MNTIELWHKRARPSPDIAQFNVQLGCHLEEVVEMLDCLSVQFGIHHEFVEAIEKLEHLSTILKRGDGKVKAYDREKFLDSLADQVVTAIGVGYCAGMKTMDAIEEVNRSNWSKFDNVTGLPKFDEHGKIIKGDNYSPPNLKGMYERGE